MSIRGLASANLRRSGRGTKVALDDHEQGIKILLVDDHNLLREGLGRLLQAEPSLRVVGNCGSIREGLTVLEQEGVDVVLLDYDLGDENGISLQQGFA
jgi:DNA-binding NarL/FixJ family response regulator